VLDKKVKKKSKNSLKEKPILYYRYCHYYITLSHIVFHYRRRQQVCYFKEAWVRRRGEIMIAMRWQAEEEQEGKIVDMVTTFTLTLNSFYFTLGRHEEEHQVEAIIPNLRICRKIQQVVIVGSFFIRMYLGSDEILLLKCPSKYEEKGKKQRITWI